MGKQSKLEKEAIDFRNGINGLIKNEYTKDTNEYSAENDRAKTHDDEEYPFGKGTNSPIGTAVPGSTSKGISYHNVDTKNGGGSYDITTRKKLLNINAWGKDNEYGVDAIDSIENERAGQYFVK